MTPRLDRLGRRTSIAVGAALSLVSTVLVVPGLVAGATATNPGYTTSISGDDTCPTGTVAVYKYDDDGTEEWMNGFSDAGESVDEDGDKSWDWSSPDRDVLAVLVKGSSGASSVKTYVYDEPERSGTVTSNGLLTNSGRTPDISHITLCGTPAAGYQLTVAARYCPDYTDVYANRGRNNLQETFEDLGPDSPYPGAFPVNPTTEDLAPQSECTPMDDWRFTLGTGISGGSPSDLSVVTGKYATDLVTKASTPELKPDGTQNGSKTVAGARTITLTADQAKLAQNSSKLWIQGGVPSPRAGNEGQLNGQQDDYAFASLRCAVDALNGDNVEWIQYTGGAKHVFCYAYYVDATDYGTIQLKKKTVPSTPGVDFTFDSNVSYDNDGVITLAGNGSTQEFKRATTEDSGTTWFFEETNLPQGWALDDITCTTTKGSEWDVDGKRVSIDLVKNDKVVCTYTNAQAASVTVTKKTEGDTDVNDGSTTTFPVTVDGDAVPLKGGQSETVTVGDLGDDSRTITVDEGALQDGWTRTGITCSVNGDDVDDASEEAGFQVSVEAGDDVDCVVTNSFTADPAIITITKKVTGGSNPAEDFGFSLEKADLDGDGTTTEDFGLNGGESETFSIKAKNTGRAVTISEDSLPAGWTLTGSSCTGTNADGAIGLPGGGDPTDPIELTVRPGEVWNCEFTNDRDTATLVLHKVVADGAEASFEITPQVDGAPLTPVTLELDGVTASSDPISIPVDGETVVGATEADQSTWHLEDAYCTVTPADSKPGDRQYPDAAFPAYDESSVTPTASGVGRGDQVDCWFVNERNTAEVVVLKKVVEGDEADAEGLVWEFPVTSGDATLATVEATTSGKGKATIVVTDEGTPVTVTETQLDGWSLESLTCEVADERIEPSSVLDDAVVTPSAGATLVDGDVLECTAVNGRDRASITVYKVATDAYGEPALEVPFEVTDSSDEAAVEVLSGGEGVTYDYALPTGGTTVTVRELAEEGWQPVEIVCSTDTASQGPLSFGIETFDADVVASSTGSLSVDVPLADGDAVACTIYNQQESGIVRVDKVAEGAGELEFGFTATGEYGEGTQQVALTDGADAVELVYPAGTVVSVSETDDQGWVLEDVTCVPTEDAEAGRFAPAAVTVPGEGIVVGAGTDITCTFTNVPAVTGLEIAKAASRGPGADNQEVDDFFDSVAGVVGQVTVYRYAVTNTGNVALSDIVLGDDLNYGPTLGSSVTDLDESDLFNCRVGSTGSPNDPTGPGFVLGSPIEGLTVAPGETVFLFCDLTVPAGLPDVELNRIFDIAEITGTPEDSETPVTDESNPVVVKVFAEDFGAFPIKNIVDEDGTNFRAFDDLGVIVAPTPKTFRMTMDNTGDEALQVTLYDYFDNTSVGLTTAQRDAIFDSMECINYDDPSLYGSAFPQPILGEGYTPMYVNGPEPVTFTEADNGGGAGTYYAAWTTLPDLIPPGDGFEVACQVLLPPGQYEFTNVFRMIATPVGGPAVDTALPQAAGFRGTAVVVPMVDAVAGEIDLTAAAGVEAGDPVDPVTPTPTPTVDPTEPVTPTPTVTPTSSDNPGPLPQTGGNVGTLAALGAAGLLAGVLLMILGGRRRDEDTAGGHL